jgi:hypothetical protein
MDKKHRSLALVCAVIAASWTNTGSAATPAPYDAALGQYGRLVVTVEVTGGDQTVNDCPTGGLFNLPIKELLKGNKDYAFFVTVSGSSLKEVNFAPVALHVKQRAFGTDCEINLKSFTYRSPIFNLSTYGAATFSVANKEVSTTQPASAVTQGTNALVNLATTVSILPKEVAEKVADPIASIIGDFKNTAKVSNERDLTFLAVGTTSRPPWTSTLKTGKATYTITVTQRLENVGSIFTGETTLTKFAAGNSPNWVLNRSVLPDTLANFQGQKDAARLVTLAADDERKAVAAATDFSSLNSACLSLLSKLQTAGLTEVDAAVLTWAVVATHPNEKLRTAQADQIGCLRDERKALESAGVTLRDYVPAPSKVDPNPQTLSWMTAEQADVPYDFFGQGDPTRRNAAASVLFSSPVKIDDPFGVLVPVGTKSVASSAEWYMILNTAGRLNVPIFDRFGCYRMIGANLPPLNRSAATMFAIGEITTPRGDVPLGEYLLTFEFEKVTAGEPEPKLASITVTRTASPEVAELMRTKRTSCARNYQPKILWP